jgi:glycosyltransferase involved in cell wall biosynthesis
VLGWVPACALPSLFAAADVAMLPVVHTPLNRAKSPMRLVHLLAFGVPTVTQAVGEYGTYVRHEETGLLAGAGDEAGLADAVVRLLTEETLRRKLGQAAAQHLRTSYAWDRLARIVMAAYDHALGVPSR